MLTDQKRILLDQIDRFALIPAEQPIVLLHKLHHTAAEALPRVDRKPARITAVAEQPLDDTQANSLRVAVLTPRQPSPTV